MTKYQYLPDDPEISGFGGGYESACCAMVAAGMEWLDAHPGADPQFHGYKGVFGLVSEDNEDAKALSEAIADAEDGCSGAQHHAAVSHVLYAHEHGWENYLIEFRKRRGTA